MLLAAATVLVAGCGESQLPNPTGKGDVRTINAILASPPITALIEEIPLDVVEYKESTSSSDWDDFSYIFNFEVPFPGQPQRQRVASRELQVVKDRLHTFVLSGDLNSPTITVWEWDKREWDGSETNFEVRFAHTAESLGAVDVYFSTDGAAPAPGAQAATLSFGEVNTAVELPEGEYIITLTTAGMENDILFRSSPLAVVAQASIAISVFDGDGNDIHPLAVRAIQPNGSVTPFFDDSTQPTFRYIQASLDMPLADIYEDASLTTPVVEDHAFGDITADLPTTLGEKQISYTPANDVGSTFIEEAVAAVGAIRLDLYAMGVSGARGLVVVASDRQSGSTAARLNLMHAAANNPVVDVYIVDSGESIDAVFPRRTELLFTERSGTFTLLAGDYDIYVTPTAEKTVLAGPFPISVALGDVVLGMIVDTVDPATAEIREIPVP